MVNKFSLLHLPRIVFGTGAINDLPALLKERPARILAITWQKSHSWYPAISDTWSAMERNGFTIRFESTTGEPSPADIDRMVERNRLFNPETVIAVGGGSVMDAGKAVSAMLPLTSPVKDYLEGVGSLSHPGLKKFFVAVPTTAGTGSEATSNAVLSETGEDGYKRSIRHENLVPDLALVDPVLTLSCPAAITAASGLDAFTQLLESYLSVKAGALTDVLALEGIARVHASLDRVVSDGTDTGARSDMAYAALLSGITLSNAGLGLIHGFASSIGGLYPIPHGVVCGTLMGVVNRYNVNALLQQKAITNAHEKYALVGKLLSARNDKDLRWYMQFTAGYIDELIERLKISRLGSYGIAEAHLRHIAESTDHKSNPVQFSKDQLVEMLRERL